MRNRSTTTATCTARRPAHWRPTSRCAASARSRCASERAQENALELATRLAAHPEIERVRYCGLPDDPGHARMRAFMDGPGGVLAFEPTGGADRAEKVCETVELFTHATSFGGVESTLERRERWAEESDEVPESLIRVNAGCEHVEDLWDDLEQALTRSRT